MLRRAAVADDLCVDIHEMLGREVTAATSTGRERRLTRRGRSVDGRAQPLDVDRERGDYMDLAELENRPVVVPTDAGFSDGHRFGSDLNDAQRRVAALEPNGRVEPNLEFFVVRQRQDWLGQCALQVMSIDPQRCCQVAERAGTVHEPLRWGDTSPKWKVHGMVLVLNNRLKR